MAIVDIYGNPINTKVLRQQQTDSPALMSVNREFAEHPSQRLTPRKLIAILNSAETGDIKQQSELFFDMEERDAQILTEMHKRKSAILPLQIRFDVPKNATERERADAGYIEEILENIEGFDQFKFDCLDGIGHGFANIEIEWQKQGAEQLIKQFHWRPQSWFTLDENDQNKLLLRTDTGENQELLTFGWVQHRHRSRSGYVARSGLFRTLAFPYLYRQLGSQGLAELLEIYGLPIRIGKYPAGTGKQEKSALLRAVTELGRSAGGIIPAEMAIELHSAVSGSSAPFMELTKWAEQSISKAVLGATLTTQADGKTSTNALGTIHNQVRMDLLRSDARQLENTINRDVIWPLLVLNRSKYSDPRYMPRIVFDIPDEIDNELITKVVPTLVDMGFPVPESWIREKTNIPEPVDNEPVLKSRTKPQLAGEISLSQLTGLTSLAKNGGAIDAVEIKTGEEAASQIEPILVRLAAAKNDTEAYAAIADAFPQMNIDELSETLTNFRQIARLVGMFEAQ